jgi:hypothetical protein
VRQDDAIVGWECAECNDQSQKPVAVCHHCGKPLCAKDLVVIFDDAFAAVPRKARRKAAVPRKARREAVHCRNCRREHHLGSFPLRKES